MWSVLFVFCCLRYFWLSLGEASPSVYVLYLMAGMWFRRLWEYLFVWEGLGLTIIVSTWEWSNLVSTFPGNFLKISRLVTHGDFHWEVSVSVSRDSYVIG